MKDTRPLIYLLMLWLLIILISIASACSRKTITTTTEVRDSIVVKETVRYDTVTIPADTVRIEHQIECDPVTLKPVPAVLKKNSGRVSSSVTISSTGVLTVDSKCDSLQHIIRIMDREIFRLRHEKKTVYIDKKPSAFKRWLDNIIYTLVAVVVLFIVVRIAWRR
jgi:hypothetical protein